jgi:hypothetical protein
MPTQLYPFHRPDLVIRVRNLTMSFATFVANHQLTTFKYSLQALYITFLNRKHAQKRESLGKPAVIVDRSMIAVRIGDEVDALKNPQGEIQDNALKDLTDWQNEDFVYVY